tara:strand:- start:6741 stop:6941 length:201 start_codon:yes stop_codon:yes gene_type:complete
MFLKFILLSFIIIFFSTHAYAYIDPGTGSIILQAIIGAIAATSLTIKIYWQKIKVFFKKKKKHKDF